MKVTDLMTRNVVACGPEESLARAAALMWENDCGCVPVVEGDGKVVGMVTDRDGFMAGYTQGRPLDAISIATAMSRTLHSCHPEDTIESAERTLREAQVRRLPVIDGDGVLVGMLSLGDIARHSVVRAASRPDGLSGDTVARTLALISQPRAAIA